MPRGAPDLPKTCSTCGASGVNMRTCTGDLSSHEELAQGYWERRSCCAPTPSTHEQETEVYRQEVNDWFKGTIELRERDETVLPIPEVIPQYAYRVNLSFVARFPHASVTGLIRELDEAPSAYFLDYEVTELIPSDA